MTQRHQPSSDVCRATAHGTGAVCAAAVEFPGLSAAGGPCAS